MSTKSNRVTCRSSGSERKSLRRRSVACKGFNERTAAGALGKKFHSDCTCDDEQETGGNDRKRGMSPKDVKRNVKIKESVMKVRWSQWRIRHSLQQALTLLGISRNVGNVSYGRNTGPEKKSA